MMADRVEGKRALSLIQDVGTHWNSTFMMMEQLLALRVPIYAVIFNKVTKPRDRMDLNIADAYWATMEVVCPKLEPFAEATELLTVEGAPTLSCVYIILRSLWNGLVSFPDDPNVASDLKTRLRMGLSQRYSLDGDGYPTDDVLTSPAIVVTALDPRHKSLRVVREEQKGKVYEALEALVSDGPPSEQAADPPAEKPVVVKQEGVPPTKKILLACLEGDYIDLTQQNNDSIRVEVSKYRSAVVTIPSPLEWWKAQQRSFPKLAAVARKYLAIPASEVPSEHVFSTAGQTITKRRASMDSSTVDSIIFIKNYPFNKSELFPQLNVGDPSTGGTTADSHAPATATVEQSVTATMPQLPKLEEEQ